MDGVEVEIQFQNVHAWFPKKSQVPSLVCLSTSARTSSSLKPRSRATRGNWNSAAAGEISGSRPEPEVVTKSMGIGALGFSACNFCTSPFTRSSNALLVGPRFEPLLEVASYPVPAKDGREWK